MTDFFRFPSTPHLAWLGGGDIPRDDKLLSPADVAELLSGEVVVEEKLDGANLGISLALDGTLRAQNRGQYLASAHAGQFARLPSWLAQHGDPLNAVLTPSLILFGEWCAARHSLDYSALPDWFLLFDVYDRDAGRFWSARRRDALARETGLFTVPHVAQGRTTLAEVKRIVMSTSSHYRASQPFEGVVVRRESSDWCEARAKVVRPDFNQSIDTHWRRRAIEWNRVNYSASR
ncbi:RNA ligase family protein [Candidatus Accumulibacter sp. ACC003]|uniref:RNA ligase family protein n=1 Tax=Candidatus Accumulibacter sp. ACC003 TaxID=2823334 RepID=UPI0025BADA19|nr:RNA ligase family protein [Candidatus Accumulibacter sp. ACC003]